MAKLSSATKARLNKLNDGNTENSEVEEPIIPPSLKRNVPSVCRPSGDKTIDSLTSDVMAEVDLLKPAKTRSNLSKAECKDLDWIL